MTTLLGNVIKLNKHEEQLQGDLLGTMPWIDNYKSRKWNLASIYPCIGSTVSHKSRSHLQILDAWRVTEAGSILGTHSFEVIVNLTIIWCSLLNAYKLIHIVACNDKNCNNYAENIKHHHSKFSHPGNQMPSLVNAYLGTCGDDWVKEDADSAFASPADTHKHSNARSWMLQPSWHEELICFISSVSLQVLKSVIYNFEHPTL
jgi:hypothetical protein